MTNLLPLPDAIPVDEQPTADAARTALDTGQPYRGIWHIPAPNRCAVHLFADPNAYPDAMLRQEGWTRDCARTEPHTCGAQTEESA